MDNNLPNDPSNPNSGSNNPVLPFGSGFNPHSNPVDLNNPYPTQPSPAPNPIPQPPIYSNTSNLPNNPNLPNYPEHLSIHQEVAQHRLRDAQGHFLPYGHPNHEPQPIPNPTDIPNTNNTDPVKQPGKFKRFITFMSKIKWTKLTLYITGAFTFIYLVISNPAIQNIINQLFPNSSPILARAVSLQGKLKTSDSGMYSLILPNQETYTLHFKPSSALANLKKLDEVVVKGNLTWTPYVIENAEVYPLNISTP